MFVLGVLRIFVASVFGRRIVAFLGFSWRITDTVRTYVSFGVLFYFVIVPYCHVIFPFRTVSSWDGPFYFPYSEYLMVTPVIK